jgi:hypothetical protein
MSELNVQSPPTLDEKLWAAQDRIRALEEQILKLQARIAALQQQLEGRE